VNIGVAGNKPTVSFQDLNLRELGAWYDGGSKIPNVLLTCSPDAETLEILSGDAVSVGLWLDSRRLFKIKFASETEKHNGVGTRLGVFDLGAEFLADEKL
jgi:hypothetical protein